jgi:hypothetical protein
MGDSKSAPLYHRNRPKMRSTDLRAAENRGKDASAAGGNSMSFTGNWKIVINSPMGEQQSSLALLESGNKLTGTQSSTFGTGDIQNGAVNGNQATWTIEMTSPFAITLEFTAHVDGDEIAGVVLAGAFGESRFQGSRA